VTKKAKTMKVNNKEIASKILRTVPYNNAFYFFTDIGQYSGELAASLADFCKKIKTIDTKSIDFHYKRRDFQKWIRGTIGDVYLANEINKIQKSIQGEELRVKICQIVERRLTELKKLLASEEAYLESI
jgi:hypothetical protein